VVDGLVGGVCVCVCVCGGGGHDVVRERMWCGGHKGGDFVYAEYK